MGAANVYPAEIEAAPDQHPAMRSCCVIGLPDEDLGNVPYAVVELSEPVSDEDPMAHLRQRLADTPGLTGISASISTAEPRSACAGRWPG